MFAYALKGMIVLALAQGAVSLFDKASPRSRHALWAVCAGGLLLMLPLAGALPPLHLGLLPGGRAGLALNLLLLGWLVPACSLICKVLWEQVELEKLRRRARPLSDAAILASARRALTRFDIGRRVAIAYAPGAMPVTFGTLRPIILLPQEASGWSRQRLDATLLHEMAHVARFDAGTQALSRLVVALHWFNPLAWHCHRSLRRLAEQACDELVLAAGADPHAYALTLLETAREATLDRHPAPAAIAMAAGHELEERLRLVLAFGGGRGRSHQVRMLPLVAVAVLVTVWLAPMRAEAPTYYRAALAAPGHAIPSAFMP